MQHTMAVMKGHDFFNPNAATAAVYLHSDDARIALN